MRREEQKQTLEGLLCFMSMQEKRTGRAKGIQISPSFCVVATYCQPSLICEMWNCVKCWGDLLAARSNNPSPGSLLGLGAVALNIQPDWGCAAPGGLLSQGRVSLAIYFF